MVLWYENVGCITCGGVNGAFSTTGSAGVGGTGTGTGVSSIGSSSCLRLGLLITGGSSSSSPSCQIFFGGGGGGLLTLGLGFSSGRSSLLIIFLIRRATGLSGSAESVNSGRGDGGAG